MLQLYPVYLLCNRRKTLTGSPNPTRAKGMNKPCTSDHSLEIYTDTTVAMRYLLSGYGKMLSD